MHNPTVLNAFAIFTVAYLDCIMTSDSLEFSIFNYQSSIINNFCPFNSQILFYKYILPKIFLFKSLWDC